MVYGQVIMVERSENINIIDFPDQLLGQAIITLLASGYTIVPLSYFFSGGGLK